MLGKTFTRDALAALAGSEAETRAAARVARAQGGARRAGRSPLAGARPVRLPPGSRSPRRLRDALEAGAPGAAPRRGRVPERGVRCDEDEVVEVVASHYVAAYEAAPDAEDAAEIKSKARGMLARAGERAASLAASAEAQALLRAGSRARRRGVRAGGVARPGRRDGSESGRSGVGAPPARGVDRASRGAGRHACRRARPPESWRRRRCNGPPRRGDGQA